MVDCDIPQKEKSEHVIRNQPGRNVDNRVSFFGSIVSYALKHHRADMAKLPRICARRVATRIDSSPASSTGPHLS